MTVWIHRDFDDEEKDELLIVNKPVFEGFTFQIVMEDGKRVLFESETIGSAIAREIASAGTYKKIGVIDGYDHSMEMHYN